MPELKTNLRDHFLRPDCGDPCFLCGEPNCEVIVMDHPHHVRCFQRLATGSLVSAKVRPAASWGTIQIHRLERFDD